MAPSQHIKMEERTRRTERTAGRCASPVKLPVRGGDLVIVVQASLGQRCVRDRQNAGDQGADELLALRYTTIDTGFDFVGQSAFRPDTTFIVAHGQPIGALRITGPPIGEGDCLIARVEKPRAFHVIGRLTPGEWFAASHGYREANLGRRSSAKTAVQAPALTPGNGEWERLLQSAGCSQVAISLATISSSETTCNDVTL